MRYLSHHKGTKNTKNKPNSKNQIPRTKRLGILELGSWNLILGWFLLCALCAFVVNLKASQAADKDSELWGTIKGQIIWGGGAIPEPKVLNVDKDQKHCLSKGPILSEEWVINKNNKGVRWTLVWLAPEPKSGKKLPIHPSLKEIKVREVEIDQPCCAFVPHCLGMREGQVLVAKNPAPVSHNVRWTGNPAINPGGNQSLPAGQSYTIEGLKVDKLPLTIECNIHPWMKARVGVFDHPYFAVTDENGNYEIKLAPAGAWRLKVYHDAIGWRGGAAGRDGEKITIKGGETTDVGKLDVKPAE
jgi:hypothetical protein